MRTNKLKTMLLSKQGLYNNIIYFEYEIVTAHPRDFWQLIFYVQHVITNIVTNMVCIVYTFCSFRVHILLPSRNPKLRHPESMKTLIVAHLFGLRQMCGPWETFDSDLVPWSIYFIQNIPNVLLINLLIYKN